MRNSPLLMFIALLPALAALGHDIYLFVINNGIETPPTVITGDPDDKGLFSYFATLGFIWTQYHPESYKWIVQNVSTERWAIINFLLSFKAVLVGLVLAGIVFAIGFVTEGLGGEKVPRHMRGKPGSKDLSFETRNKKKAFKYKRK